MFLTLAAGASIYYAFYLLYTPVAVVVPNKLIEARAVITDQDVKLKTVGKIDKYPNAITDIEEVLGKYAEVRLYPREQIIPERITANPGTVNGAFSYLAPDETYITFGTNEAKWPEGLKVGDTLTAVAYLNNQETKLTENLKVIGAGAATDKNPGIIQQAKEQVQQTMPIQNYQDKITLAMKFTQTGPVLAGLAKAKKLVFLPESPQKKGGVDIYEPQSEQIQPQGTDQKGTNSGKK
ncbi:SAF domain-containing protein [Desulfotruncus arcticus]|uniref:SAF domain-containing protein n=1 Tax=Desulfotruncus arcticus TaxID=341036 RepID=UPI000A87390F|nr:SAF domain-containing protein [Desulfotruncus arcticus]